MHRVAQLADRPLGERPPGRPGFRSLIPLKEILAEIADTGVQSRLVSRRYDELLARGGTELALLLELPVPEVARLGGEALGEAVRRMRAGEVRVEAGYDGEYGRIALFERGEARELGKQALLFAPLEPRTAASAAAAGQADSGRSSRERVGEDLKAFRGGRRAARQVGGLAPRARSGDDSSAPPARHPPASPGQLNPEQRRAVEHGNGPALVLAGPGTGKTAVLAARVAHLVRSRGVPPERITAVTFTNRAAGEMRERLGLLLPDPRVRERVRVGTFHALGLALLKSYGERLDLAWPFTIVNREQSEELLASLPACPKGRAAALAETLSLARQADEEDPASGGGQTPSRELLTQYEATLALHNAVDLDDLLRLPVRLLAGHPEILEQVRARMTHLLIDEYQDVNAVQYRLLRLLMPAGDAPLFAIGDPDQAIYGFRGADPRFLGRFLQDYPQAGVYALPTSYRCSETILRASSAVLPPGRERRPRAAAGPAERPVRLRISEHASEASEAEHVARTIEGLMGGTSFLSAGEQASVVRSFADIAVLCRVARQMDPLAKALADHAIPFQAASDEPWLRQEPARSILRILQALRAPGNTLARERVLQARLASAEDLQRWRRGFEQDGDLAALLPVVAAAFPESEAALASLVRLVSECGGGIDDFLESALLGSEPDALAREAERVSLLTLHAAKGLEYACVFITGCEDGLLPYTLPSRRPADPQEERRLFYVGMTRARSYLYLSHARRRFLFGRELRLPPSPFLAGLGEELAERLSPDPQAPPREPAAQQLDLFG
jgi:superfamily I DNA/RNA helicase